MAQFEYMFTVPVAMPNGLQGTDGGLWIADQESDDVFLVDGEGTIHRRLRTEMENGSGIAYGDGALWLGSNGPSNFRKALDVHCHLSAQITFYIEAPIDDLPQSHYLRLC